MQTSTTVLTAARSHDLTTIATLKSELNITRVTQEIERRLDRAIKQATGAINRYCGHPFGSERVSQAFWPEDGEQISTLLLERRPVVSPVESVTVDSATLDADNDYELRDAQRGMLVLTTPARGGLSRSWTRGISFSKIVVIYTGGYELLGSLPEEIEKSCLMLATKHYLSAGRDPALRSVELPDVGSRTFASAPGADEAMPLEVKQLLAPYRKVL